MRRFPALALTSLAATAAPANAQQPPAPDPLVLRGGTTTLTVRATAGGSVCPSVSSGDDGRDDGCERPPTSPQEPIVVQTDGRGRLGLVLDPRVAVVEASGVRVPAVPVPGAEARAALVRLRARDDVARFVAGDGTVVGAVQDVSRLREAQRSGSVLWRRGRWRVRVARTAQLEPDPLAADHVEPTTCLTVARDRLQTCRTDADVASVVPAMTDACPPDRPVVVALVPGAVARVRARFGDGSRRTWRTRPLPAALGPGRVLAATLPRGLAVRSTLALDARGRTLRRHRFDHAPTGRCRGAAGVDGTQYGTGEDGVDRTAAAPYATVAQAGTRRLEAADGRDRRFCWRLAGRPRSAYCGAAPVSPDESAFVRNDGFLEGVVSAEVAEVRLRLADGQMARVATGDGPGYQGRYAGRLRFVGVALARTARVRSARAFDATGRRLHDVFVDEEDPGASRKRVRSRRVVPGVRLRRSTSTAPGRPTRRERCLVAVSTLVETPSVCTGDAPSFTGEVAAAVTCRPRRAVVFGIAPAGATGVRLVVAGGARLPVRLRRGRGLRAAFATRVAGRAAVRAVRFAGHLKAPAGLPAQRRLTLRTEPANKQCGYRLRGKSDD